MFKILMFMRQKDAIPLHLFLAKARIHAGKCSLSIPVRDDNAEDAEKFVVWD